MPASSKDSISRFPIWGATECSAHDPNMGKGIGVLFPEPWGAWDVLNAHRRIRNVVVHSEGKPRNDAEKKDLEAAPQCVEGSSIGSDGSTELDGNAIFSMVKVAHTLLSELYAALEQQDVNFRRSFLG